ncbi:MAG: histidine phosphatase family protein [Thermoguttaceae bacterium]
MLPSPAPDTCWLYLVRHGETDNNRARPPRLQGRRSDEALSENGRRQAEQTGRLLSGAELSGVYSSPLLRARQTAEAIARPHRLKVVLLDELVEADVGAWEGRNWAEIERSHPHAYRAFMENAADNPYLGGETIRAVVQRSAPVLERLLAENVGRSIAVVAHNAVNRAWLTRLLGLPTAQYRSVPQDNCGVSLIRYRNGKAKAVTVNGVFHLETNGNS